MRFETLKFEKNKKLVIGISLFVLIILAIVLTTSLAKYKVTESIQLVKGTINFSPSDIILETYVDNELVEEFPSQGVVSYQSISCTNETTAEFNEETWSIKISNLATKGTKCKIYFINILNSSAEYILADKIVDIRDDFTKALTTDTTGTVFTAKDDDGTSYYYAGAPTDNWFYFGGYYWRIIRINGDGTVRLIYSGTSANETGTGTQIGTSTFSSGVDNNMYVGYMYTSGSVHGLGTSSIIKGVLDNWYSSNLSSYSNYISFEAGFCGDRQTSTSNSDLNGSGGTGTTLTYYGAFIRLTTDKSPSLKCVESSDLYTSTDSNKGNKVLTYPIGLITADEATYAGASVDATNSNFYLYTGQNYWTISPLYYGGSATVFNVNSDGSFGAFTTDYSDSGVRPVINLRADLNLTGSGTSAEPYEIMEFAKDVILSDKTINERTDFSTTLTSNTTGTIYSAEDDDGTSYYYAGAPTDNWVKFANLYWRIIRINGDETIRLIYSGTSAATTGTDTQYTTSAFNSGYDSAEYVGFMYTIGSVHGTGTKSTILGSLETFYTSKLASYADYLDTNAGFCNDRTAYTDTAGSTSGGGTGTTETYYAGYIRLIPNKKPSLKCTNSSDLFTKSGAAKGNKALTYPVGLITADEVAYAGGVYGTTNESYYLYTGEYYWTLSPRSSGSNPIGFNVNSIGSLNNNGGFEDFGVRPVINLRADVVLTGNGTSTEPYVVKGAS